MSLTTLRSRLVPALLLALLGCNADPFTAPKGCGACPLPPTKPPVVKFIIPTAGGTVNASTTLYASATDDIRVTGVEFFYSWTKLHPGVIGAPPYRTILGKYFHDFPIAGSIQLQVVAHDVEGNADTDQVTVSYVP